MTAFGAIAEALAGLGLGERAFDVEPAEVGDVPHVAAALERLRARIGPRRPAEGRFPGAAERPSPVGAAAGAAAGAAVGAAAGAPPMLPLVAAPYMGEVAGELCVREGVGWIDLSGNARIRAPGRG